jgi:myo-inositol 2-dehydrogenase / D-chiro-inositol 1-dehydrogenase
MSSSCTFPHSSTSAAAPFTSPMKRRQFVGAALTLSTPFLTRSVPSLRGADSPRPAASNSSPLPQIKLGVVGCGGRGSWIARLFQQHGGYTVHAVADYFPEVAEAVGATLGVESSRRFSGLSGFQRLYESGVEAVALETPPWFLPEQARQAVAAGLHVYMAKPVAVDVTGCHKVERAAAAATANQRCFLVDYQIPTDPHNREVVQRIRQNEIGSVVALNSHYYAGQFADPPLTESIVSRLRSLIWVNDVALGGGYHVNACIHAIDAALWVAGGPPIRAMGLSRAARPDPHGDSHDVFQLLFEFENGILLTHRGKHLNNLTGFDVACEIQGETGYGEIRYGGKAFLKSREDGYSGEVLNPYEAGAVRNIAKFHTAVVQRDFGNDTVRRSIDGALTTILGREAGRRRSELTLADLLKENAELQVNLEGLKE